MKEYKIIVMNGKMGNDQMHRDLAQCPNNTELDVTIAKHVPHKKRSVSQNAYWFKVLDKYVVPVFREYGDTWSSYKVHEYLMNELGYQEVLTDPKGRLFVTRRESRRFKTTEWEEFMENARAYIAEHHQIEIPLPNEES